MDTIENVLPRTIFLTVAGSHLYGTNIPGSDYDYKGVCVPTHDYFFGWMKSFEQLERHVSKGHPADLVIMSVAKFCKLAVDCNPNVIENLFATDDDLVFINQWGEELRSIRGDFISKKARHTFAGYAHAQLKRIKTHRRWLLEPPKAKPTRQEFGLMDTTKVSKSELGAFNSLEAEGKTDDLPSDILALFLRERQYQAAMMNWSQYENWKATRNEARAGLEARFGFDTKHGMHLIRLMRMCREILADHKVIVKRPDFEELLAIRRGEWSYDRVVEEAETLDAECGALYQTSTLRNEPPRVAIDTWLIDFTQRYLRVHG